MFIFKALLNFSSKLVFFPFLCLFTFQVLADEEVINSSVFVLMDYSSTYYKDYRHQLIKDNFRKLTSVLGSQRAGPKPTTTIEELLLGREIDVVLCRIGNALPIVRGLIST